MIDVFTQSHDNKSAPVHICLSFICQHENHCFTAHSLHCYSRIYTTVYSKYSILYSPVIICRSYCMNMWSISVLRYNRKQLRKKKKIQSLHLFPVLRHRAHAHRLKLTCLTWLKLVSAKSHLVEKMKLESANNKSYMILFLFVVHS